MFMTGIKSLTCNILDTHVIKIVAVVVPQQIVVNEARKVVEPPNMEGIMKGYPTVHPQLPTVVSELSAALAVQQIVAVPAVIPYKGTLGSVHDVGGVVVAVSSYREVAVN